jgi:hypothetical protein
MKSKLSAALAAICLVTGSIGAAKADPIFDVSATFDSSCPGCTLGGTLGIDTATGSVTSQHITIAGESPVVGPFTIFVSVATLFQFSPAVDRRRPPYNCRAVPEPSCFDADRIRRRPHLWCYDWLPIGQRL